MWCSLETYIPSRWVVCEPCRNRGLCGNPRLLQRETVAMWIYLFDKYSRYWNCTSYSFLILFLVTPYWHRHTNQPNIQPTELPTTLRCQIQLFLSTWYSISFRTFYQLLMHLYDTEGHTKSRISENSGVVEDSSVLLMTLLDCSDGSSSVIFHGLTQREVLD